MRNGMMRLHGKPEWVDFKEARGYLAGILLGGHGSDGG
jgi:hypothetical protein